MESMQSHDNDADNKIAEPDASSPQGGVKRKLLVVLICIGVIGAGILVASYMVRTQPKAGRRPPAKMKPLVSVMTVQPESQTVIVQAMGTVVPAKELVLKSRVEGEIIELHPEFVEGGQLRKGEQILQIDELDYRLIVSQRQGAVADARYSLTLELGRQDIARREWSLLNGDNPAPEADAELALRKPHLEKAESDLTAAEAELQAAKLQLARTKLTAPFNAVVRSTHVQKGSQVAVQESLATLVNTDEYWVQVAVPIDQLRWIQISKLDQQAGADAEVLYHGGSKRSGSVIKMLSDLEKQGRMARLVISVTDPLGLQNPAAGHPAMLIGEYVKVLIQGRQIDEAYRIPRSALRDDSSVWVVGQDGKLQIRSVTVVWRDTLTVLLQQGLQPGERIIVSDMATPVDGMMVEVENGPQRNIKPASTTPNESEKG